MADLHEAYDGSNVIEGLFGVVQSGQLGLNVSVPEREVKIRPDLPLEDQLSEHEIRRDRERYIELTDQLQQIEDELDKLLGRYGPAHRQRFDDENSIFENEIPSIDNGRK